MGYIKWTYELVKDYIESLGYELVSNEYINYSTKLIFKDKIGYFYYYTLNNLRNGWIPRAFDKNNPYTIQNIELWIKVKKKNVVLLSKEYKGTKDYLQFKCLADNCGEIFKTTWSDLNAKNAGCSYCSGQKVGLSNCLATKNPELAAEWHPTLNGRLTPFDVTGGSNKDVWWQCKDNHEHVWHTTIEKRKIGRNCPECNRSKGEMRISDCLNKNNIVFDSQRTFSGLIGLGGGNLLYDFYLPNFNLLIEYQGIQHEQAIDFNGFGNKYAENCFKKQQEHDNLKREYANKNNYNLLEIWYYDFDNIEKILEKEVLDR